jgi:hypothetical protein
MDRARRYFNLALDDDPEKLEAFEAVDALCTRLRDWKRLEQSYGRMIKRLPQEGKRELKVMLWHNLGEILRTRRRDFESAIAAFEAADRLEPHNTERERILSELYLTCGEQYADKAVAAQQQLIQRDPSAVEPYRTLRDLYMNLGHYDAAWCLCEVLAFMGQATDEEMGFYRQYRRQRLVQVRTPLADEHWARVRHPAQHPGISAAFGLVIPAVAGTTAKPAQAYGLKPGQQRDPNQQTLLTQIYDYATAALNVTRSELYMRPERPEGLMMAHTPELPSFSVGKFLLERQSEQELAFCITRQLAYLRPQCFLRNALPSRAQLHTVLLAVLLLVRPETQLPREHAKAVGHVSDRLQRHLDLARREQLATIARKLKPDVLGQLESWWRGVDLTADRAALLLCGDLSLSAAMLGAEPAGEIPTTDRIKQLVLYAASPTYTELRRRLGLSIDA